MPGAGWLLLATVALGEPAETNSLPGPRLNRGDELVYRGTIVEAGERIDNRFRKTSDLEIRLYVLTADAGAIDCAVMTSVLRKPDAVVAAAVGVVSGNDPAQGNAVASVRIDLIRVDRRGRVKRLTPPAGPPPLLLDGSTPLADLLPVPLDAPPSVETGMFIPLPPTRAVVGTKWDTPGLGGRPPVGWEAVREFVWNGGLCTEVRANQQTAAWDRPAENPTGWRQIDTCRVTPADGIACQVQRRIERREGINIVGWVEVNYELAQTTRFIGPRYGDVRHEAEAAYAFAADVDALLTRAGKVDRREFAARLMKIDRYLSETPTPTSFRPAIAAVRRRCEAALRSEITPVVAMQPVPVEAKPPPELGQIVPDFLAQPIAGSDAVRLASHRRKPVVLVFVRPKDTELAAVSLMLAETLQKKYTDRAAVLALAVASESKPSHTLHERLRLTIPLLDGTPIRTALGVDTYPRFLVIAPDGTLAYRFDGFGNETGYLLDREISRLLPKPPGTTEVTPAAQPENSPPPTEGLDKR